MNEKDKKDAPKPEPYNPEKAWWSRQTPATLSGIRRRQQHQFSQDIGGCDANYKKGF
jgi:hypothetical protein